MKNLPRTTLHSVNSTCLLALLTVFAASTQAQNAPRILTNEAVMEEHYLPDFSYAGYHHDERPLPTPEGVVIQATDHGVIADDGIDDSRALIDAVATANAVNGPVVIQLPPGRLILSEILYLERSNLVLRGAGTGERGGTELYFPRPLKYVENPEDLAELREYLTQFNKRQREKDNNLDLPFSQYAWSGGFIWTRVPGERVKSYLEEYARPFNVQARVLEGKRGERSFRVADGSKLQAGEVVLLQIFNKEGEGSRIISELYQGTGVKIGGHHWNFPELPLVTQQVVVQSVEGDIVTIASPLTIDVQPSYRAQLVEWKHLEEVGIEHFRLTFPNAPRVAHHVEPGFNAIFLTSVFNGWVRDVVIHNADSGILTEEIANVTIRGITTTGPNIAHYTVAMAGVHNVLAENIDVYNYAAHPLSFNTFSTKNVYRRCEVFVHPVLDQHSGANHQNLFDDIRVHVDPGSDRAYPLFKGGGAGYWKPAHGAYSTFWNIDVQFQSGLHHDEPFLLNGMEDGPFARLVGVHGNHPVRVEYGPEAYQEWVNKSVMAIPSLYAYQLARRLAE